MKKVCSVMLAIGFGVGMSAAAMAASVAGTVASPQRQSITGVHVIVKDASGRVIGQGIPGSNGTYNISGLQPDKYSFTLDPGTSRFQGQTVVSYVGSDGICLNWSVSTTSPAIAAAQPDSTCDPVVAGGWDTAATVGVVAGAIGAGAIAAAVSTAGSDNGNHRQKSDKH